MSTELQWIVGTGQAAVRRRDSRVFSLWPKPGELGRVPMGLHMALGRPNDELYSNPTATRALVAVALPAVPISGPVAATLVLSFVVVAGIGVYLPPSAWAGLPAQYLSSWQDLASVFVAAAFGYCAAALWEAGICQSELELSERCFGIGAKGPTVEPVVWRLGLPVSSAWLSLLGPLSWSLALVAWGAPRPTIGNEIGSGARAGLPPLPAPRVSSAASRSRQPDG